MFAFLKRAPGNAAKIKKRQLQKRSHEESLDAQREEAIQQALKRREVELRLRQEHCPFTRELEIEAIVKDRLYNIIDVIVFNSKTANVIVHNGNGTVEDPVLLNTKDRQASSPSPSSSTAAAPTPSNKANPSTSSSIVRGKKRPDLTWNDRAIGVFLLLHPSIYGLQSPVTRIDNTAKALGASPNTVRQWVSLRDKGLHSNIQKWYGIVKHMEWGTIKNRFTSEWVCQFTLDDDANVRDHLDVRYFTL
jgi:hypothetical protein